MGLSLARLLITKYLAIAFAINQRRIDTLISGKKLDFGSL